MAPSLRFTTAHLLCLGLLLLKIVVLGVVHGFGISIVSGLVSIYLQIVLSGARGLDTLWGCSCLLSTSPLYLLKLSFSSALSRLCPPPPCPVPLAPVSCFALVPLASQKHLKTGQFASSTQVGFLDLLEGGTPWLAEFGPVCWPARLCCQLLLPRPAHA